MCPSVLGEVVVNNAWPLFLAKLFLAWPVFLVSVGIALVWPLFMAWLAPVSGILAPGLAIVVVVFFLFFIAL